MTEGQRLRHRRVRRSNVALGAVLVVATLGLSVAVFSNWYTRFLRDDVSTVRVMMADTQQIHVDDPVRVDGRTEGRVASIEAQPGNRLALVTLKLHGDAPRVYRDARVELKWKTLLGSAFYVALEPGTARSGELGEATIPEDRATTQVELEDVTDIMRGAARGGFQGLPGELAEAFADPDLPTMTLRRLADASPAVRKTARAMRGIAVDHDLSQLVASTARTVRGLNTPTQQLRGTVSGAAATFQALGRRQAEVRELLRRAPSTMQEMRTTLARLDRTLGPADKLIATVSDAAPEVAPTLARLRPSLDDTRVLLGRAEPLLESLRPAARSLAGASNQAVQFLSELQPGLDRLEKTVIPELTAINPDTKHSTAQMIGPFFSGMGGGIGGQIDENGRILRFPFSAGSSPVYGFCQVYLNNPDAAKALACQSLEASIKALSSYDPLGPTPGVAPSAPTRKGR